MLIVKVIKNDPELQRSDIEKKIIHFYTLQQNYRLLELL